MKLIWSELAKLDYWSNIDYLLEEFGEKEASAFISKVEETVIRVDRSPELFPHADYKNLQFVVIVPKITLFYRVKDESVIELIRFWNNTRDPNSFKEK